MYHRRYRLIEPRGGESSSSSSVIGEGELNLQQNRVHTEHKFGICRCLWSRFQSHGPTARKQNGCIEKN